MTQSQMNGVQFSPVVSCKKLPIPYGTDRGAEVLFMSLLYPNNLMNSFVNKHFPKIQATPWCVCGEARETPFHIIMECKLVPEDIQLLWSNHIDNGQIVNKSYDGSELLLGLSREVAFVRNSIDIIKSEVHQLRTAKDMYNSVERLQLQCKRQSNITVHLRSSPSTCLRLHPRRDGRGSSLTRSG